MKEKLHISDHTKVRIIKVKDWSVSFRYEDKLYLLHISQDGYETGASLYERVQVKGKRYELKCISGCYADYSVYDQYIRKTDKGKTYKSMDTDYFVRKMSKDRLCTSYMDIKEYTKGLKMLSNEIKKQEANVNKLRRKIRQYIG